MTCADWRGASSEALGRHYERERARWEHELDWDTSESWREVELARRADRLPGVVLTDGHHDVRGFGYCFVDGAQALLGPLVTDARDGIGDLLASLLDSARRAGAARSSYFGLETSPQLNQALRDAGFDLRHYVYLSRPLDVAPRPGSDVAQWSPGEEPAAARLLQAAYGPAGRYFAPDGRPEQWERYVRNLVAYTGCGRFDAASTCLCREAGQLTGVALVTTIRPAVSHLAQLAVDPSARGRGIGGRLLDAALVRAASAGHRRMTLLAEASSPATRLYASRGFTRRATFLAGWLGEIRADPG